MKITGTLKKSSYKTEFFLSSEAKASLVRNKASVADRPFTPACWWISQWEGKGTWLLGDIPIQDEKILYLLVYCYEPQTKKKACCLWLELGGYTLHIPLSFFRCRHDNHTDGILDRPTGEAFCSVERCLLGMTRFLRPIGAPPRCGGLKTLNTLLFQIKFCAASGEIWTASQTLYRKSFTDLL